MHMCETPQQQAEVIMYICGVMNVSSPYYSSSVHASLWKGQFSLMILLFMTPGLSTTLPYRNRPRFYT